MVKEFLVCCALLQVLLAASDSSIIATLYLEAITVWLCLPCCLSCSVWASLRASLQLPRKASSAEVGMNVDFHCPGPSSHDVAASHYGFVPALKMGAAQ